MNRDAIAAAIDRYRTDPNPDEVSGGFDLRGHCVKHDAVPLLRDMSGCYVLTRFGIVKHFKWDEPEHFEIEQDPKPLRIALHHGSLIYPSLRLLVPERPAEAVDCTECENTSRITTECSVGNLVCSCGGLGWILPDESYT